MGRGPQNRMSCLSNPLTPLTTNTIEVSSSRGCQGHLKVIPFGGILDALVKLCAKCGFPFNVGFQKKRYNYVAANATSSTRITLKPKSMDLVSNSFRGGICKKNYFRFFQGQLFSEDPLPARCINGRNNSIYTKSPT